MSIGRIALLASVVGFAALGVPFLLWPVELSGLVGIELPSATARTDVRAVYGGFQLGLAAFLAYCAARPERTVLGLAATAASVTGLAMGRLLGTMAEGEAGSVTRLYLSIEASSAVLAALALWYESRRVPANPRNSRS